MKGILETLRSARKIEWLLLAVLIAALTLYLTGFPLRSGDQSDLESRLQNILQKIDGAGDVEVMVVQGTGETPEGVLLVTKGARDVGTCLRLQRAVHTLLGLEISRIEVVQRGN